MFNPYLPANHQNIDDLPEPRELKCEVCGLYYDDQKNSDNIDETGMCVDCYKKYLK